MAQMEALLELLEGKSSRKRCQSSEPDRRLAKLKRTSFTLVPITRLGIQLSFLLGSPICGE